MKNCEVGPWQGRKHMVATCIRIETNKQTNKKPGEIPISLCLLARFGSLPKSIASLSCFAHFVGQVTILWFQLVFVGYQLLRCLPESPSTSLPEDE